MLLPPLSVLPPLMLLVPNLTPVPPLRLMSESSTQFKELSPSEGVVDNKNGIRGEGVVDN